MTELITGVDLVREQLWVIAAGRSFARQGTSSSAATPSNAASTPRTRTPSLPSPGTVKRFLGAGGPGVRLDTHIYDGYRIPPNTESMIGKLIVHGRDRATAVARMRLAPRRW